MRTHFTEIQKQEIHEQISQRNDARLAWLLAFAVIGAVLFAFIAARARRLAMRNEQMERAIGESISAAEKRALAKTGIYLGER